MKPFPIPVIADLPLGIGSHTEDETLDYISMPQGMSTYRAPPLPEPEDLAGHQGALVALRAVLAALDLRQAGGTPAPVLLAGLAPADLTLINQVLGEGEVSAQVLADPARPGLGHARIQESVFAGVWRVVEVSGDGRVFDRIEVGDAPALLREAARADASGTAADMLAAPPGVLNAQPILVELEDRRQTWRLGQPAQVVNLTLLPVGAEDIAFIDHVLGTGRVLILSRGYGNCRITNCRVANTWRVVYYNSQDTVILNSVEVVDLPEVACAAREDLEDSRERLLEVLEWVAQ
ncbi:hydrogenase expression/formation protein [Aquabacterium sp. OR-4]|uniref:hydrogenase expression/formation protein n=1 Tax=Aquabacterium sp. OR-4 TaxID=2978127 RepID=UPI0021B49BCD|nr:hydrogenase expression/formation protein [Aquabacterium sp. OR-4]MDT7833625.1 hydrogenase expression/formation protein [Aquabacterium sp. OR-4]